MGCSQKVTLPFCVEFYGNIEVKDSSHMVAGTMRDDGQRIPVDAAQVKTSEPYITSK